MDAGFSDNTLLRLFSVAVQMVQHLLLLVHLSAVDCYFSSLMRTASQSRDKQRCLKGQHGYTLYKAWQQCGALSSYKSNKAREVVELKGDGIARLVVGF